MKKKTFSDEFLASLQEILEGKDSLRTGAATSFNDRVFDRYDVSLYYFPCYSL